MNRSQLLQFLTRIGAQPKKGLSQNFLISPEIVSKIADLAQVGPSDFVLEIGPGPGALTEELLRRGAQVLAVEMDPLFAEHLHRLQTADQRLQVRSADFLKFPLETLLGTKWKVVANLPYHITTPILEKLCSHSSRFHSFTIMMQKEVADRIQAKPKTKAMGSLTLFLQFYTAVFGSFLVPPESFYPEPSVHSTVIRLDVRVPPSIDPEPFFALVHKAYQQRRKMIATSLRETVPNAAAFLEGLGLSPKSRPEELSLNEWITFYSKIFH